MRTKLHSPAQRRSIWPPQPGTFGIRLARNAWRVPARITHDVRLGWQAEIDDVRHPHDHDPALAVNVALIWHHGLMLPMADFLWLHEVREWAKQNSPDHPSLFPMRAIDPNTIPPIPPSARVMADLSRGHHG